MYIHLLSLTDFDMHPEAAVPVLEWPLPLTRRVISLEFQICDDNLFIMNKARQGSRLVGWNWRKGKQIMVSRAVVSEHVSHANGRHSTHLATTHSSPSSSSHPRPL